MRGVRGLYYLTIAALVWHLLYTFSWYVMPSLDVRAMEVWMRAGSGIWLVLAIVNLIVVIPFSQGRQGSAAEGVAKALLILVALNLTFDLLQALPEIGGPRFLGDSRPVMVIRSLMWAGAEACLWLALVRSQTGEVSYAPIFWGMFAVSAALGLFQSALPRESLHEFFMGTTGAIVRWGRFACGLVQQICMLALLRRLLSGEVAPAQAAPAAPSNVSAAREIVLGSVFLLIGVAVTLISYSAASETGGRYMIATGAIAFGLVRLIRGLVRVSGG